MYMFHYLCSADAGGEDAAAGTELELKNYSSTGTSSLR